MLRRNEEYVTLPGEGGGDSKEDVLKTTLQYPQQTAFKLLFKNKFLTHVHVIIFTLLCK